MEKIKELNKEKEEFSISEVLEGLQKRMEELKRPFFSEEEFQVELAKIISKMDGIDKIELEVPFKISNKDRQKRLDILVTLKSGKQIPIELKYKTAKSKNTVEDYQIDNKISFELKNHMAQTDNRYRYIYDIWRIQTFIRDPEKHKNVEKGYAIMLTNDSTYKKELGDNENSIHEGRNVKGELTCKQNKNKEDKKTETLVVDKETTIKHKECIKYGADEFYIIYAEV